MTTKKKPSRTDILVIHTHHNLGKYLGLTTSRRFSKWYVPVLLSLFVVCSAYKIRERVIMYTSMSNVRYLTITLDIINFATNLIYIGISLLGSLFGRRKWEKLFAALGSAEELLPTNFFIDKSVRRFKLITAIYHLILLACYSCNALHLILRNLRYTLRFSVTLRIAIYFGTFDVISVYLFNEAVRKRYAHLVKMILSSTIRDGSVEVILKNEEEKGRVQKLRKVFSIHKTLYACVEQLNDIFGWKIYLVLQNVVVSLLSTFNSVVLFLKDQHLVPWKEEIIYSTVFSAVFAIMATILIMSCNGVEESGRRVTTTCYKRLRSLEKSDLRNELLILAKCTQQLQPKMSAAGFFILNQTTLTSTFSFLTTYLIIVIQFNLL